ncbi:MAG: HEAT repeat domain-containing protein [Sphingomonadaceae bacterium]
MRIDPALHALRSEPALQRAAQVRLEQARHAWQTDGIMSEVASDFMRFAADEPLAALPCLTACLSQTATGQRLVAGLVGAIAPALRHNPFGLVPFRHQLTAGHAVLELVRHGRAALSLMVYRPQAGPAAASVCFTSGERYELCLRGEGQGRLVRLARRGEKRAELAEAACWFGPGWLRSFDNGGETKLVDQVTVPLVMLRLSRDPAQPGPAREYRLTDGALIHQAAGDRRDSRRELALAVLGGMGRRDALPAMQAAARSGASHVRWEAVRQVLAMDSGAGFALLGSIARDPSDALSAPAAAQRARLLETVPQLARAEEGALCPA